MGTIIKFSQLPNEEAMLSRLLIYDISIQKIQAPKSVSKSLSEKLLVCNVNRRSMKLGQIFNDVLDQYPDGVVIKDIDVMFNPKYEVNILKILSEARKRKRYSVVWPGRCENGMLIYSEEGYSDYKVYEIDKYDITCVI